METRTGSFQKIVTIASDECFKRLVAENAGEVVVEEAVFFALVPLLFAQV